MDYEELSKEELLGLLEHPVTNTVKEELIHFDEVHIDWKSIWVALITILGAVAVGAVAVGVVIGKFLV